MSTKNLAFVLLLGTSGTLTAQRTWVVDINGGGDFRSVTSAFARAATGDTVLVRKGKYYEAPSTSKGLFLLGVGRPQLDGLRVQRLPRSSSFVVSGLDFQGFGTGIALSDNLGRVHLEDVVVQKPFTPISTTPGLNVQKCQSVSVNRSVIGGYAGVVIYRSTVHVAGSQLTGTDGHVSFALNRPAQPGLSVSEGTVFLGHTLCTGGRGTNQITPNAPAPGIRIWRAEVVVTGSSQTAIAAGTTANAFSAPAILAFGGTLHLDGRVQLRATNTTQRIRGITPVVGTLPALVAAGAAPGLTVATRLYAPAGWVSGLFLGLPGERRSFPPHGDLWLDPRAPLILLDVGPVPTSGDRGVNVTLPSALPRGLAIGFQALTLSRSLLMQLSSPVTVVLH